MPSQCEGRTMVETIENESVNRLKSKKIENSIQHEKINQKLEMNGAN